MSKRPMTNHPSTLLQLTRNLNPRVKSVDVKTLVVSGDASTSIAAAPTEHLDLGNDVGYTRSYVDGELYSNQGTK